MLDRNDKWTCSQGDNSWQASLRALCAIEAVIKQGSTTACGEIAVYFQVQYLIQDPSDVASRLRTLKGLLHESYITYV